MQVPLNCSARILGPFCSEVLHFELAWLNHYAITPSPLKFSTSCSVMPSVSVKMESVC